MPAKMVRLAAYGGNDTIAAACMFATELGLAPNRVSAGATSRGAAFVTASVEDVKKLARVGWTPMEKLPIEPQRRTATPKAERTARSEIGKSKQQKNPKRVQSGRGRIPKPEDWNAMEERRLKAVLKYGVDRGGAPIREEDAKKGGDAMHRAVGRKKSRG